MPTPPKTKEELYVELKKVREKGEDDLPLMNEMIQRGFILFEDVPCECEICKEFKKNNSKGIEN